jgi:hypothetical protein
MSSSLPDLINALDEAIITIQMLAELGPAIDEGGSIYFPHCIQLLSLIAQHANHLDRLSSQLALCVLPRPRSVEDRT